MYLISMDLLTLVVIRLLSFVLYLQAVEKHRQLLGQLQNLIFGPKSTPQSCSEVLTYFLEKLTLSHITPRKLAMNVCHEPLSCLVDNFCLYGSIIVIELCQ